MSVLDLPVPTNEYVYRHAMLGREAFDQGRLEAAELFYRAALEYARQGLKHNLSDPIALRDVAICWEQLGYLLQRVGEVGEAGDAYYEAERRYSDTVKLVGRYGESDRELARHLWRAATLPIQVWDYSTARDLLERSYEILWVRWFAQKDSWDRLGELAEAMIRLGVATKGQCDLEGRSST